MHGPMHPIKVLQTYPMTTHFHLIASNFPTKKTLVAKQQSTSIADISEFMAFDPTLCDLFPGTHNLE